ncbi:hypothetical protein PPN31114_02854 [Pandoraea pneumonica]|uniref:DUF2946 domain-containing protein n=1 Tax=Pandoraea pneumonica TaxID=2508299 RepID=A0A5E4VRN4_9BURK|nr:DUF2946 domain-containing protein [Pandoraea pneumonica]VVE15042.1 hypothetical protein PPN31114_02854 [Pandoraea pneumonica]
MRKLRQHRVAIGIALLAILLAALMPAIAQWRAAMQKDPFAVYCTVQGTQAALGTNSTPRADAQRDPAHDGHSGHDDAQAPPATERATSLHSEHSGPDHSLASAEHWEKCGYCTLWAHQPLVASHFLTPPTAAPTGIADAPRVLVPYYPRARFSAALARAPPSLIV